VPEKIEDLQNKAMLMRRLVLQMIYQAGSGHPGGSLSSADIVTALYFSVLNVDPARPDWPERDRFVLSKGHACPILYAALALRGFFPMEELWTLRKLGSRLQGHPDRLKTPGVDATTGSLGQGISIALGMALGAKLNGAKYKVYALLGDGEQQEGQMWEAAMAGAHYSADNLIAIIDNNGMQIDGSNEEIMSIDPLPDKWRSFGWRVLTLNGHDMAEILQAFEEAKETKGQPTVLIARTVKGKGVSFMENRSEWHSGAPTEEQYEKAMEELEAIGVDHD
jgi:transketolase